MMMDINLLFAVFAGVAILLFLILRWKWHPFMSLLISAIAVGLFSGITAEQIITTIKDGMAGTLGFVATIIGLGAMFGAVLESSGSAKALSNWFVDRFGLKRAPFALTLAGFFIAIPVFFEVGFILIVPVLYSLRQRTNKSLLYFAIPLLAGLAVTHAFIPPTPGPIAVADILGADLGWVIIIGAIVGLPTALISGPIFGKYISKKINVGIPENMIISENTATSKPPNISTIFGIICLPIVLILLYTFLDSGIVQISHKRVINLFQLIGHPFVALIIANIVAWYFLGIRLGFSSKDLLNITQKSMAPAGTIILITGAGGVFKQMLVETGAGQMIAQSLNASGFPLLVFAFLIAAIIRITQGSATVAMITAAGLVSPMLANYGLNQKELACLVIAIASGASTTSHVNDSGFWLVNQYLGMTEKQTLRSWTVMTTILAVSGLLFVLLISKFI